jgi:DNA-binding CsgD family transcriptional regulator
MSQRAAHWLKKSAGLSKPLLPEALARWAARRPQTPFWWKAHGQHIRVSVADRTRKGSRCLILEECASSSPPLTAREATVLHWVSYGKTNEEIAALLKLKICTVKKNLERIYEKLGVENRTAAASFLAAGAVIETGVE